MKFWRGPNLSPYHITLIGFRLVLKPHPFTPFRLAPRTHTSFFRRRGLYISFSSSEATEKPGRCSRTPLSSPHYHESR